jgi:hypothetical protein
MSIPLLLLALLPVGTPGAFHELHADHAEASSYLKSNWNKYEENYHPTYVLDGDPKTAWVEGKADEGVGESITIPLSTLSSARALKLRIKNGYQRSAKLLAANAAPARITVIVKGANGEESARTTATLAKKMGAQDVVVDVGGKPVASVTLVVDSVTPGTVYTDTCISDIAVFVDSVVPHNAKAENAKLAAAKAWRTERVERAKYFARLPPDFAFSSSTFDTVNTHDDSRTLLSDVPVDDTIKAGTVAMVNANHPLLAALTTAQRVQVDELVRVRAKPATKRLEFARKLAPLPEGLEYGGRLLPGLNAFLVRSGVVWADVVNADGERAKRRVPGVNQDVTVSDAVVDGDAVFVRLRADLTERVPTTQSAEWLLRYEGKLLRSVVALETTTWDDGGERTSRRSIVFLSLERGGAGTIERVRKDEVYFDCDQTCSAHAWSETLVAMTPEVAAARAAQQ